MIKWQRKYILDIQGTDGAMHEIASNPYMLTMEFSIVRRDLSSAGTANFRIYNLNQSTRDVLFKDHFTPSDVRTITLRAGYESEPVLPIIFNGNINYCCSHREEGSVNFVTEINAFDYGSAMSNTFSSFNKDTYSRQRVVEKLVDDMVADGGCKRGKVSQFLGDHPRGRSILGNTWDILRKETDNHCFIDNGTVHCLQDGDCIPGDITEISSDTGLLGSPKREESYVRAEVLFEPRLLVGQQVFLNSQSMKMFNGTYKVTGIAHQGVISDAVSGKCKTIVSILLGSFQLI